jgi:hypothetical protein
LWFFIYLKHFSIPCYKSQLLLLASILRYSCLGFISLWIFYPLREVIEVLSQSRPFISQYESFYPLGSATRAGQRVRPVGQLPRVLRNNWSNTKYAAGTHRISTHARTFPKIMNNLCTRSQSIVPVLSLVEVVSKNVGLKGARLLACQGRPRVWGRPCLRYCSV